MAVCPSSETMTKQGCAIQAVIDLMKEMQLYYFKGDFYFLHPEAIVTKVFFMTASGLLGHLIANKDYSGTMLPNSSFLNKIFEDESNTIIPQLEVDYDNIEVRPTNEYQIIKFHNCLLF